MHNHNPPIVHGDLKGVRPLHPRNPAFTHAKAQANVLVSPTGVARIADFGFAQVLAEHSDSFTQHTSMKGTLRWMAPELLLTDDARHTAASDMWAFGCLCVEASFPLRRDTATLG